MNKQIMGSTLAVLAEVNPFLMIGQDGQPIKTANAQEAYFKLIMALYKEFPKGYIDLPYFMVKRQGLTLKDAEAMCGMRQYALVQWEKNNEERNILLRRICQHLLSVSGVAFNENAFWGALSMYNEYLLVTKSKEV